MGLQIDLEALEPSDDYLELLFNGIPFSGVAVEKKGIFIISRTEFVNGMKCGFSQEWFANGNLLRQQLFYNDVLHGLCGGGLSPVQ